LAYGADRYIEWAKALARSLTLHSPDVPRAVITDAPDSELRALFQIVVPLNRDIGVGNRQKVYLDKYTPFRETLFIDSDSLVIRSIDEVWKYFEHVSFGIPGAVALRRGDRDPKIDVDFILDRYNLDEIPKFNSGLIYFDSSEESSSIFEAARDLLSRYEELRFSRSERPFDEPLFAVSMAIHGVSLVQDQGKTMRTPTGMRGRMKIDVRRGICVFKKYGDIVEPAVAHFAGRATHSFEYRRECFRLRRMSHDSHALADTLTIVGLWVQGRLAMQWFRWRSRASAVKWRLIDLFNPGARDVTFR
jgi:hypothetical protein